MIINAQHHKVETLLTLDRREYRVPRYQREYSWQRPQWDKLFEDLASNPAGHFLGSIICIAQEESRSYEVIDGQQRLTTISIFIAALYKKAYDIFLKQEPGSNNQLDAIAMFTKLKALLFFDDMDSSENASKRLTLQNQQPSQNDNDFKFLTESLINDPNTIDSAPRNYGNRRIARAFRFFQKKLDDELIHSESQLLAAKKIAKKLLESIIVKIDVANHTNAFLLFESINNSGLPLTPMDLIKNKIISSAADINNDDISDIIVRWDKLMELLGDSAADQERYFRHLYNANIRHLNNLFSTSFTKAEKNNVIEIYYRLAEENPSRLLSELVRGAVFYSKLINQNTNETPSEILDLARAQGTPGYILLLHLHLNKEKYNITESHINKISKKLSLFFARRNLTNFPSTRETTGIFMRITRSIENENNPNSINEIINSELKRQAASDELTRKALEGDIYEENSKATRFILYKIASRHFTRENAIDLWRKENSRLVWSIEHILPQGSNIPEYWAEALAPQAVENTTLNEVHQSFVHKLGNLTLTAYNSHLGNSTFIQKRDRTDASGNYIGYKNGIKLNEALAGKESWTPSDISERTQELVTLALETLSLED